MPKHPNILLMMADQFRADAMGCAGNPHIQTPGLDRMAAEGTRFAHGYTPVPVCIAARHATLMGQRCAQTGRYANNIPNPEPLLYTLPQLLGHRGYHTRAIGKMHWKPMRNHHGFHRMELQEETPAFREDDDYLRYLNEHGWGHLRQAHGVRNILYHMPQVSPLPEEHHASTWVADRTVEFLRRHRRVQPERPFFCWTSWIHPHPPFNPPESFANLYDPGSLPLPVNYDRPIESLPPACRGQARYDGCWNAPPERRRKIKAAYYACASLVDKGVGRILHTLDELGMSGETLVLFVADHGEMLGDHNMVQKSNPYQGASNIPFLMRMPGRVEAGRVSGEFVTLLDIMPTALELAEAPYPGPCPLAGSSLLGRPGGGLAEPREEVVVEHGLPPHRWLALRRGTWKYHYFLQDGWEELYDLAADPHECVNLLRGPHALEHRARADDCKRALAAWEKANGFAESLEAGGALRNFGEPAKVPEPIINKQLPPWNETLSPEEAAQMESWGDSMLTPLRHETTVRVQDLDLKKFKAMGGSFEGRPEQKLLDEL
ncbi:MAG: sulfatase-like hydrolase/transferase [Planctomycetota bacterium]|nr:sulfatase-like hydrolase/transferase [Planctomycetota bacterium]